MDLRLIGQSIGPMIALATYQGVYSKVQDSPSGVAKRSPNRASTHCACIHKNALHGKLARSGQSKRGRRKRTLGVHPPYAVPRNGRIINVYLVFYGHNQRQQKPFALAVVIEGKGRHAYVLRTCLLLPYITQKHD